MFWKNKSRSSDRIEPMLKKLEEIWKLYPDFRLGQLIVSCADNENIFGIEDDIMFERMEKFYESLKNSCNS